MKTPAPSFHRALHLSEVARQIGNVAKGNAHYVHRLAEMIREEHSKPVEDVTVGELLEAIDTLDMKFSRAYGKASRQ